MSSDAIPTSLCATLTIANQHGEMVKVANWVEQMGKHFQLPERTVFKLELILDEALPNIISYAYPDEESHDILITLTNRNDYVEVEIIDDGIPFNPFAQQAYYENLTLESAPVDGRGIRLITFFTELQEYRRVNQTNLMRVNILKTPEAYAFNGSSW